MIKSKLMDKKFKISVLTIFVLLVGFLVFSNNSFAQECRLTGASWNRLNAKVGEQVTMRIDGQNCNGQTVTINIFEDDTVRNDKLGTLQTQFDNNVSVFVQFVFTQANYERGNNLGEGDEEEVFFEAVVGSGATESMATSNNLILVQSDEGDDEPEAQPCLDEEGEAIPCPDQEVVFELENPIAAESLVDLAKAIGRFLLQIAIPIAVIVIIYAGILFLTSQGKPEQINKAKTALLYAVIGLAVILIGQGFFTLIKSILDLGGPGS